MRVDIISRICLRSIFRIGRSIRHLHVDGSEQPVNSAYWRAVTNGIANSYLVRLSLIDAMLIFERLGDSDVLAYSSRLGVVSVHAICGGYFYVHKVGREDAHTFFDAGIIEHALAN